MKTDEPPTSKTTFYSRELGRVLNDEEAKPLAVFHKKNPDGTRCPTCKPIVAPTRPALTQSPK